MANKRLSGVKRILDRNGIQYEVKGFVVVTQSKDEKTMAKIAHSAERYVSRNCIIYNIRKSEPPFVNECSLEIDTGTERDAILKTLSGVEYQESYGYFTTPSGEVYITDALDIVPETSIRDLIDSEDRHVNSMERCIIRIREMNNILRRMDITNPRHQIAMLERQGYIDEYETLKNALADIRKELREKFAVDA